MFFEEIIGAFTGQNRRNRHKNFVVGTTLGLMVGSATALLLAPQSGKDTREDIQKVALKTKDKAIDLAQQGYEYARDLASRAGETLSDWREDAEEMLEDAGEKVGRARRSAGRRARKMAREALRKTESGLQKAQEKLDNVEDKVADVKEEL